jgi:NADPH:quinone reductase-like Zn-dependent oxidoreductase
MKAIVQDRFGAADVLQLREIDRPAFKETEVLVRVRAASVNPADWAFMQGVPNIGRFVFGWRKPRIRVRGIDLAGTVEGVGAGVTGFAPGDEVFGQGTGAFAEYATATPERLVPKPSNLTFEQAAAVPMAALCALQALRAGHVEAGQKVLIIGAGGGIGTFAVQIAKSLGATVTGVCGPSKVDLVRSLGADRVVDYTAEDFAAGDERYDFILDNVSNRSLADLRRVLVRKGTLIPNSGQFYHRRIGPMGRFMRAMLMSPFVSQTIHPVSSSANRKDLTAIAELIEAGQVRPVIDRTYPLASAADAMRYLGEGHVGGKVVVTVA